MEQVFSGAGEDLHEVQVTVVNRRGLHARAAAKFVKEATRFRAEIQVFKGAIDVSGRSIMGLMMLAAAPGATLTIRAFGSDAAEALAALTDLVERRKFDED